MIDRREGLEVDEQRKRGRVFEFGGFKGKSATVSMARKRVHVARLGWIPMQKRYLPRRN